MNEKEVSSIFYPKTVKLNSSHSYQNFIFDSILKVFSQYPLSSEKAKIILIQFLTQNKTLQLE